MKTKKILIISAAVAMVLASGSAFAGGDAEKGKVAYKKNKCAMCHKIEAGKNSMGPSLAGIMGKTAGTVEGFKKYKGLKGSTIVWTDENLDKFLTDSKAMVEGLKMPTKIDDAATRADIIAYLNAN